MLKSQEPPHGRLAQSRSRQIGKWRSAPRIVGLSYVRTLHSNLCDTKWQEFLPVSLSNTTQRLKLQARLSQYTAQLHKTVLGSWTKKTYLFSSCHSGEQRFSHSDPFLVYLSIHNFIRSSLPHSIEPRGIFPDHQGIFYGYYRTY